MVDQSTKIFHESWYRIANQRICLRSSVRIHRQFYRGEKWYVLFDPFTNQYFRLQQAAYDFIIRLSLRKTVEEVWYELLKKNSDHAPGQGEIIEILSQMYRSNMLHYDMAQDSMKLFERQATKKRKKIKTTLFNIFYLRLPLLDPDAFLKRIMPVIRILLSKGMALVWLVLMIYAGKIALDHFEQLQDQAQGVLAPSNLFMLYLCSIFVKTIHEFGHSCVVRKYGGEVHTVGLMFMLLAPLPYMDATASWSFRNKWKRVFVALGGMIFEFFVAAIALIVWANVGGGPVKAVAYNLFFIASVTTFLFNINPLMRFDGYYALSDALDIPNLQQQSSAHLKYLLEKWVFKRQEATTPATTMRDNVLFTFFGIASSIYKIFLFGGIVVSVSQHFLLLALVMALFLVLTMLLMPIYNFVRYVFTSPQLMRVRSRAITVTVVFFTLLFALLAYVPMPDTFTAPGILEAIHYENAVNKTAGHVVKVLAQPGQYLQVGDTLLVLESPELENKLKVADGALNESQNQFYQALAETPENMDPIAKRIDVMAQEYAKYLNDRENLVVRAGISGVWVSPDARNLEGKWLPKGDSLGIIIDTSAFRFVAVIPQEEVSRIFSSSMRKLSVKLKGHAFLELPVDSVQAIPMEQNRLPSAALGWYGGGDVEVNSSRGDPQQTAEPFYEVRARISARDERIPLLQGRSGKIRFHLGYTPLLAQGYRKVRQMLQKYYRV